MSHPVWETLFSAWGGSLLFFGVMLLVGLPQNTKPKEGQFLGTCFLFCWAAGGSLLSPEAEVYGVLASWAVAERRGRYLYFKFLQVPWRSLPGECFFFLGWLFPGSRTLQVSTRNLFPMEFVYFLVFLNVFSRFLRFHGGENS